MIAKTRTFLKRLKRDERGLSAVEYAVLGAMVVAAIGLVRTDFETNLQGAFTNMFADIN